MAIYFTLNLLLAEEEPEEEELEPEEELEGGVPEEEEGGFEEEEVGEEGGDEEEPEELEGGEPEEEPPVLVVPVLGGARCGPKKGATADSFDPEYANADNAIHKRTATLIIIHSKRLMFRLQDTPQR